MAEKMFNLIYEPWVKVLNMKGGEEEVSLLDFYKRAHEFKTLAGELPTQDIAVLRLLLAILYAVFTRVDTDGNAAGITSTDEALERWKRLWGMGIFPYQAIEQYLRYYEERFYLFHPKTPFYQVAGLTTRDKTINPIAQVVADVPSRIERRFFTTKCGNSAQQLSFAEAARWLINLQAWDYAGKKASTIGGSPNGGGTGWLGKLGVVYAKQKNMFETLLLNMILLDRDGQLLATATPIWEREPKTVTKLDLRPNGYIELLTWQSRRIQLFKENDAVIGVLSSYGDVFDKENTFVEQMSGWHKSTEKKASDKYIPNLHSSSRSMWRDLESMLPQTDGSVEGNVAPGIVTWMAVLKTYGCINFDRVNINAVGSEYGAMQGVVNEIIADSLSLNVNILTNLGKPWLIRIFDNIKITDQCVWQLGTLAYELAAASGNDDTSSKKGISATAREQAYFSLDIPFRNWLARINPETDEMDKRMFAWLEQMKKIILRQGERLVQNAGEKAFTGIYKKDANKGVTTIETAPKAYLKFKANINKIIRG